MAALGSFVKGNRLKVIGRRFEEGMCTGYLLLFTSYFIRYIPVP